MIFSLLRAASHPWLSQSNPALWSPQQFSTFDTAAGETVSPETAMGLAANFACIDVISTDESVYPINIWRRTGANKSVLANDVKAVEYRLLNASPNDDSTAITARRHIVAQCLGRGNGFWEIQRLNSGQLYQFHQIQSSQMDPEFVNGALRWKHRDTDGTIRVLESGDLIHLVGPTDNGYVGWPVSYYASECFGVGLAQQKFEGAFFGNGAMLSGVLTHPGGISPEQENRLLESWARRHSGEAGKMWKTGLLPAGVDWKSTAVNPKDAAMIESRRYNVEEVCRWYRMPPDKIMSRGQAKGWNTTEAGNKSYLLETLMPWCERFEAELDRKLFGGGEEFYCAHDFRRLLEPDATARADRATKLFSVGAMTVNELREQEGLNPIGKDGDTHFVPTNLQPLERALAAPAPAASPAGGPASPSPQEQTPAPTPDDDAEAVHRAFVLRTLERAGARALRKEAKALARMAKGKGLAELAEFESELATELIDEFCAILETPRTVTHTAIWLGYAELACAEYRASKDVAATSADREARLPAQWAREMVALLGLIGVSHA